MWSAHPSSLFTDWCFLPLTACVVSVSDLLMTSLAKLTVSVARRASDVIAESEV